MKIEGEPAPPFTVEVNGDIKDEGYNTLEEAKSVWAPKVGLNIKIWHKRKVVWQNS
jgi:hypothetical protein